MLRSVLPIRGLTTRFSKVSLSTPALPANLQVAKESVFDPKPVPLMDEQHYYFPVTNVPETIQVHKFLEPGQFAEPIPLTKKIFEVAIRRDIINDVIRCIRNKTRQPHRTKRMADLAGSNKKPRPQKGQGYAQVGNRRNSAWVGGMKAHGPVLRDFTISINRKVRALSTMMTFAAKFREGNLMVVDSFDVPTHKTKDLITLLKGHGCEESKILFVDEELTENFARATNNLDLAKALTRHEMNIYEALKKDKLIITRKSFEITQANLMTQYLYNGRRTFFNKCKNVLAHCEEQAATNGFATDFKRIDY